MLDQADLGRRMAQRGSPLRAGDLIDVGRYLLARPQVRADKNDAGGRRRRHKAQTHGRSGQIAHAPYLGRPREGPLIAITEPSHVGLVLSWPAPLLWRAGSRKRPEFFERGRVSAPRVRLLGALTRPRSPV